MILTLLAAAEDLVWQIERGIAILKRGGVVAFPTDTVYGLGAASNNPGAVRRVFEVKLRPLSLALPILLAEPDDVDKVAVDVSPTARKLIQGFWPGALTLVLKKSDSVFDIITASSKTVAVRTPSHHVAVALIKGVGVPLVGTSANVSGQPSPLTAAEVETQLGDRIGLIIDGGTAPLGVESTIVDASIDPPRLLREGVIPRAELEKVCHIA